MVAGAETTLSDSFMVGNNAIINFSRSVGGTNTNGTTITDIQPRGSSIELPTSICRWNRNYRLGYASCNSLTGQPAGSPSILEIEATGNAINI
jgi:hypothetical protein